MPHSTPALASVMVLLLLVGGCSFRIGGNPNAADEVRAENLQLKKQVDELNQKLELRTDELDSLRQQEDNPERVEIPGADPPVFTRLKTGRYTGALDTDKDGRDDVVRIYVQTLDQRGRFMPVAGRGVVQVVFIQPDSDPEVLAEKTYEPTEWDNAYRTGLIGTHYTLEVELPEDLPDRSLDATTKVTFTQADTGVEKSTQAATRIAR